MIAAFHFLRPWFLLCLLPLAWGFWRLGRINSPLKSWSAICDAVLLKQLLPEGQKKVTYRAFSLLALSAFWVVFSLSGPSWSKYPVPSYTPILPRVVLLELTPAMLLTDLSPRRLTRAKYKLHDLFKQAPAGQLGFIVFSSEPFVVSPLTEDAKTIDALLDSITPAIMPVSGYRLDLALNEAAQLIHQAGFQQGQILVLAAETPNQAAESVAENLARSGIMTSVIPIRPPQDSAFLFERFAAAGGGLFLPLSDQVSDLQAWFQLKSQRTLQFNQQDNIPLWRDEGRWFLIPALLCMLPVFRRGALQGES